MNGFEQHGITHLSPSSINLWINAPDVWVVEKLFGRRGTPSPGMFRGIAVERGVVATLKGQKIEDATGEAEAFFDGRFLIGDERTGKERAAIAPMIENAVAALTELGPPEFDTDDGQNKITLTCKGDGWSLPFIGYLDLDYPWHGLVVDLKTTMRMPSTMSAEHQVQRCIYSAARGNKAVRFLYVTPAKAEWREDGDTAPTLARVKAHAHRLERLLRDRTREEIAGIIPVNEGSFYWRGNEAARSEIYGL